MNVQALAYPHAVDGVQLTGALVALASERGLSCNTPATEDAGGSVSPNGDSQGAQASDASLGSQELGGHEQGSQEHGTPKSSLLD